MSPATSAGRRRSTRWWRGWATLSLLLAVAVAVGCGAWASQRPRARVVTTAARGESAVLDGVAVRLDSVEVAASFPSASGEDAVTAMSGAVIVRAVVTVSAAAGSPGPAMRCDWTLSAGGHTFVVEPRERVQGPDGACPYTGLEAGESVSLLRTWQVPAADAHDFVVEFGVDQDRSVRLLS